MLDKLINTLRLARKPSLTEFKEYSKLILLGVALLGSIGFVIYIVFEVFIVV